MTSFCSEVSANYADEPAGDRAQRHWGCAFPSAGIKYASRSKGADGPMLSLGKAAMFATFIGLAIVNSGAGLCFPQDKSHSLKYAA